MLIQKLNLESNKNLKSKNKYGRRRNPNWRLTSFKIAIKIGPNLLRNRFNNLERCESNFRYTYNYKGEATQPRINDLKPTIKWLGNYRFNSQNVYPD